MNINVTRSIAATASVDVDDAVGVEKKHWFVAIVNHNSEKNTASRLAEQGYECFVATQRETRVWRNGKRAVVDRVVIGSTIFIRCTERERRTVVTMPYINRFLTNRAATTATPGSPRPIARIPAVQIEKLRFMLGHSDTPVELTGRSYGKGDMVRVVRGGLRGLEGEVIQADGGKSHLLVRFDILGCARCEIDPMDLEPIHLNHT